MKKITISLLLLVSVGASAVSSFKDKLHDGGGPIPTCYPGTPQCPNASIGKISFFDGGGPIPTCYPGTVCK